MDCCAAAQESLKRSRMLHISNNTVQTFPSSAAICQQTATPDMHIHVQLYGCKACCPLEQHAAPCLASSAAPHKRRKQKNACPFKFLFSESKCSAVPPCPPDKPPETCITGSQQKVHATPSSATTAPIFTKLCPALLPDSPQRCRQRWQHGRQESGTKSRKAKSQKAKKAPTLPSTPARLSPQMAFKTVPWAAVTRRTARLKRSQDHVRGGMLAVSCRNNSCKGWRRLNSLCMGMGFRV